MREKYAWANKMRVPVNCYLSAHAMNATCFKIHKQVALKRIHFVVAALIRFDFTLNLIFDNIIRLTFQNDQDFCLVCTASTKPRQHVKRATDEHVTCIRFVFTTLKRREIEFGATLFLSLIAIRYLKVQYVITYFGR